MQREVRQFEIIINSVVNDSLYSLFLVKLNLTNILFRFFSLAHANFHTLLSTFNCVFVGNSDVANLVRSSWTKKRLLPQWEFAWLNKDSFFLCYEGSIARFHYKEFHLLLIAYRSNSQLYNIRMFTE